MLGVPPQPGIEPIALTTELYGPRRCNIKGSYPFCLFIFPVLLGQCVSFVALGVWWFLVFGGPWLVVFGALWWLVGAGGNCNVDCSTVSVCRM